MWAKPRRPAVVASRMHGAKDPRSKAVWRDDKSLLPINGVILFIEDGNEDDGDDCGAELKKSKKRRRKKSRRRVDCSPSSALVGKFAGQGGPANLPAGQSSNGVASTGRRGCPPQFRTKSKSCILVTARPKDRTAQTDQPTRKRMARFDCQILSV